MTGVPMTIEEACMSILGDEVAVSIIAKCGIDWAIPAAMARAQTGRDDPRAIAAIDAHIGKVRA